MIRGPIVPLTRPGLVALVQQRSELFERGLAGVGEALEVGGARLFAADALLRDAHGTPVWLFAAEDHDDGLPARVLAAQAFWQRNARFLPAALPEGRLTDSERCRLLVVGGRLDVDVLAALDQLRLPDLEVVEVEPFYVGGQERIVVRTVRGHRVGLLSPVDPAIGDACRRQVEAFATLAAALDPRVRLDGDRYSRRAAVQGLVLGACWYADGAVWGAVEGEAGQPVRTPADLRALGDRMARRLLADQDASAPVPAASVAADLASGAAAPVPTAAGAPAGRNGIESLRASMAASRLTPAESAALSGLDAPGGAPAAGKET